MNPDSKTLSMRPFLEVLHALCGDRLFMTSLPRQLRFEFQQDLNRYNNELDFDQFLMLLRRLSVQVIPITKQQLNLPFGLLSGRLVVVDHASNLSHLLFNYRDACRFTASFADSDLRRFRFYSLHQSLPLLPLSKIKFASSQFLSVWPRYLVVLIFLLVSSLLSVVPVLLLEPIFNQLVPSAQIAQIIWLALLILAAQSVSIFFKSVSSVSVYLLQSDIEFRSMVSLVDRFLSAQILAVPTMDVGVWSLSFKSALAFTSSLNAIVVSIPLSLFTLLIYSLVFGVFRLQLSTFIVLLIISMLPALVTLFLGYFSGRASLGLIAFSAKTNTHLYQTINTIGDLRALGLERSFDLVFSRLRTGYYRLLLSVTRLSAVTSFLSRLLSAALVAFVLFLYSSSDGLSQGDYLVIFTSFIFISSAFSELARSVSTLFVSAPSYFSSNALRNLKRFAPFSGLSVSDSKFDRDSLQGFALINASFGYEQSPPLFDGLSLEFKCGQSYAVTGAPGSGKSSLLKLLLGAYTFSQGQFSINGLPVSSLAALRERFHCLYIPQSARLIGITFRDFLDPDQLYVDDQIFEALASAGVEPLIRSWPMQLSSNLSDVSADLSLAQRQLLHVARAVLVRPSLLLSDEPTAYVSPSDHRRVISMLNDAASIHVSTLHRELNSGIFDQFVDLDQMST